MIRPSITSTDKERQEADFDNRAPLEEPILRRLAEKSPYPEPEEALDHVFSFSIRERELNRKVWTPQVSTSG